MPAPKSTQLLAIETRHTASVLKQSGDTAKWFLLEHILLSLHSLRLIIPQSIAKAAARYACTT